MIEYAWITCLKYQLILGTRKKQNKYGKLLYLGQKHTVDAVSNKDTEASSMMDTIITWRRPIVTDFTVVSHCGVLGRTNENVLCSMKKQRQSNEQIIINIFSN